MTDIIVDLYYADWCGHCKKFKPVWNKICDEFKDKIKFNEYESKNEEKIKLARISGYPTIKITVGGNTKEYDGERNKLGSHLNSLLQKSSSKSSSKSNSSSKSRSSSKSSPVIQFYYKKTCPYCIEFDKTWNQLKDKHIIFETIYNSSPEFNKYLDYHTNEDTKKYPGLIIWVGDKWYNYRDMFGQDRPSDPIELLKRFKKIIRKLKNKNKYKLSQTGGSKIISRNPRSGITFSLNI